MANMNRNKTRRNRTRRNKREGGGSCGGKDNVMAPTMGGKRRNRTRRNKTNGGKRKMSKGASDWNKKVMGVYSEMKKKNSNASFRDALVEASKRKKAGTL
jgi:hypothetical protein